MPGLPPIIIKTDREWASGGITAKPPECHSCPWARWSHGFCPDFLGDSPKLALVFTSPSKDDINRYRALSGDMGDFILNKYLKPIGLKKSDLLISYVLRCNSPWDKRYKRERYPTGVTKDKAESACRIYDDRHAGNGVMLSGGLATFDPNIMLITFDPKDVFRVPSYHRQLRRDMEKARKFLDAGYRPMVLFGSEAAELYFPEIKGQGSAKGWRGHFKEMEFKFQGNLQY